MLIGIDEKDTSVLTIGGHKAYRFGANGTELIAHTVSGSFHWSLSIVKYQINGVSYTPNGLQALTDSGTSYILIPSGKNKCIL